MLLSGGSCKTNFSTQYNICKSGNPVDQWSDNCTITSIESKIYIHNSFSGKATQPTFQTRNEIAIFPFLAEPFQHFVENRHFAIFGRTI